METRKVKVRVSGRMNVEVNYSDEFEVEVPVNATDEEIKEIANSQPGAVEELLSGIYALNGQFSAVDEIEIDGSENEEIEIEDDEEYDED